MKRFIALLIALILVLSFAACAMEETEITENETVETETEENIALYEEILVNFGAIRKHDGSLVVSRKGSFYDFAEIEDCSALDAAEFYTWVASRSENSDKVKVLLTGFEAEVYAFTAEYYENEVTGYFDVTSEYLQNCEFYYADQTSYYSDAVSSSEEYTYIEFVSAEETDGVLTVHFTLTNSNGTTDHALSVKLLSETEYNYISYIAE